jgi:ribosomal protein L25 (general stress protein Ctc)
MLVRGWSPRTSLYQTALSRSIRTLPTKQYVRWRPPKESLTVLNAQLRPAGQARGADLEDIRAASRVPIAILSRNADRSKQRDQQIDASLCLNEIKKVIKTSTAYSQVFAIKVEGREEPVKAIVANLYRLNTGEMNPINITFTEFTPGKRHKIQVL